MVSPASVSPSLNPRDWYIDQQDSYFDAVIHPSHRKYFRFLVWDDHYLSSVPRSLTKCMVEVAVHLR